MLIYQRVPPQKKGKKLHIQWLMAIRSHVAPRMAPTSLGSSSEEGQGTQGLFQNVVEGWIGVLGMRVSVYPSCSCTYAYIQIYIYIYMCVCLCTSKSISISRSRYYTYITYIYILYLNVYIINNNNKKKNNTFTISIIMTTIVFDQDHQFDKSNCITIYRDSNINVRYSNTTNQHSQSSH